jgi:AbrB family looped-hinge helix DNA binding protein
MKTIKISSKNQVVIPSSVRSRLGLRSGDRLVIDRVTDKEVVLKKEPKYKDLIGTLPAQKPDPVRRVRDLRDSWE